MRLTLRALAFVAVAVLMLQNPLAADIRPIWLPDILAPFSDNREMVCIALGLFVLCTMALSLGAARAGLPLGEIVRALFHK